MATSTPIADLARTRYLLLRTQRRDGSFVATPIWFAADGDRLWFRSGVDAGKIRRLRTTPVVELTPCNWKGRIATGAPTLVGTARVVDGVEADLADRRLAARYGWEWNVIPNLPIPGINDTSKIGARERLRRMRAFGVSERSCIVEVTLQPTACDPA